MKTIAAADHRFTSSAGAGESTVTLERPPVAGIVLGCLVAIDEANRPLVRFSMAGASKDRLVARAATPLAAKHVGRDVAILFEGGDPMRPIIIGLMHQTCEGPSADRVGSESHGDEVDLDLTAKRQVTLRCGQASITLTSAGKIILRGTYLFSRSSGVNKIKGGSVQIN